MSVIVSVLGSHTSNYSCWQLTFTSFWLSRSVCLPCSLLCLPATAGPRLGTLLLPNRGEEARELATRKTAGPGRASLATGGRRSGRPPVSTVYCLLSTVRLSLKFLLALRTTLAPAHTQLTGIMTLDRDVGLQATRNLSLTLCVVPKPGSSSSFLPLNSPQRPSD